MNYLSVAGLLIIFTYSIITVLTIKHRRNKIHDVWIFFNISVALWGLGAFLISISKNYKLAYLSWQFAHMGIIFIPISFFHTIYIFCNLKRTWLLKTIYIQGIIFLLLSFLGILFKKDLVYSFNSFYYIQPTTFYNIFLTIWVIVVFYGHLELVLSYEKLSEIKRIQISYFFLGTFLGFGGGLLNFFEVYNIHIYPFGNFFLPLYPIIVTYAIFRYRLMGVSLVITRTGLFVFIYSLVLGIPFLIAYSLRPYLIGFFADNWWLVPMTVLTILATVGPFIYIYIQRKAEGRLLREQRQYQNTLRNASNGMIRVRDLKKLLNLIVYMITRTVKIEFAAIFLLDSSSGKYKMVSKRDSSNLLKDHILDGKSILVEQLRLKKEPIVYEEVQLQLQDKTRDTKLFALEKQMQDIKAAVVIPSFMGNRLLGILLLGKKFSGKIYSQDDLNVFSVLANQAALAVENAQFYEDIKETQEQLFQAEKMATIGTMADGLSHQVNNRFQALSVIAGDSLDILQNTDISNCSSEIQESFKQLKYALERIQMNVKQGGEIVRGLLKYSRPGQKGFEFVDFNKVIDGALEMAQYKVKLHELNIERQIPADLPKLKCNQTQLEEVFFNLIDNAYDAIQERKEIFKEDGFKGKITIVAIQKDKHLWITFKDNGVGINDKDKNKLFTPFFTTKASSRKGTGLGLYVIQRIIGFHEGAINIDSAYGKGTKFEIAFPAISHT